MSALLNMNQIRYKSWKGKTLEQVVSSIQKNEGTQSNLQIHQLMRAQPLKLYRREIASNPSNSCNVRTSTKIENINMPGSTIVSETYTGNGLVGSLHLDESTNSAENPPACKSECIFSPEANARRRVRSSGMIPKKHNINKNNDQYCTSTNQYLVSRNRTIKQNEYNYIRKGNSGVEPGTGLSKSNIYSPAGLSHCYQPEVSAINNNNHFQYLWVDGATYDVFIPDGKYDVDALNQVFRNQMTTNEHYFIDSSGKKVFLLNISYNNLTEQVILYATPDILQSTYPSPSYTVPLATSWLTSIPYNAPGSNTFIIILDNQFSKLLGTLPGQYGSGSTYSQMRPDITQNYVALYYKPSNPAFGTQGAVDSSTRIHRRKYNTINDVAHSMGAAYGTGTANAMAYGVSETPYSLKQQTGFEDTAAPVIKPDGSLCVKKKFIYRY